MSAPDDAMLRELLDRYQAVEISPRIASLYDVEDQTDRMFAAVHDQLNQLFSFLNTKARGNGHFNADESRQLLALIEEVDDMSKILEIAAGGLTIDDRYRTALETCRGFLNFTQGSGIPDGFLVDIIKYEPAFLSEDRKVRVHNRPEAFDLQMIGSGSYAHVYRYFDTEYEQTFALKRAKKDASEQDLKRFRQEFDVMKSMRSPYIVNVHRFDADQNQYTMEHCDATLRQHIEKTNNTVTFSTRKRMALQFLYGARHLHARGHLHRDVSYQNVLVKQYDGNIVVLKLSDFGLIKRDESDLTRTESELRGTILDPTLESFKDYALPNEIYCIGFVLSFIFSGRKKIGACTGEIGAIIDRCVHPDPTERYASTLDIIQDVENLPNTTGAVTRS